jgi:DNA-binding winged helix-turn-helix (wHTH) protein
MQVVRFGDIHFEDTFLFARRGAEELKFTRHERALLVTFTAHARKLLRRDQLLDAIADTGSEISDRNIDFLVNRLRAKLGDDARSPKFIATQYGEGYVWVAEQSTAPEVDWLLVIGPVFGLDVGSDRARIDAFLHRLRDVIEAGLSDAQPVLLDAAWRPGSGRTAHFSLEVSFHADARELQCAAVLRDAASHSVVKAFRLTLDENASVRIDDEMARIAAGVRDGMWRHLTDVTPERVGPTDVPLELRIHDAALLLGRDERSWLESGARIAAARQHDPDCPRTALMWGMHLFARLILEGPFAGTKPVDRMEIEDEIEAIVLGALPAIRDDPILELAAAKLLFFIDRGYLDLAEELTEAAFARSTAFAAAFAMLGQVRLGRGRLEDAVRFFDRGIELTEYGTPFHIYLLVLKSCATLASGDRTAILQSRQALYVAKPSARIDVGAYLVTPDEDTAADVAAVLEATGETGARALLDGLYHLLARHCGVPRHRENVMAGLIAHLVRRFGVNVVPQELQAALPGLFLDRECN